MDFSRVVYEVTQIDPFTGLICVLDEKGRKSEIRVEIGNNAALLTGIKEGDKLELEVNGWRIRSIRKINPEEKVGNSGNGNT
jgi:hypothetical protein